MQPEAAAQMPSDRSTSRAKPRVRPTWSLPRTRPLHLHRPRPLATAPVILLSILLCPHPAWHAPAAPAAASPLQQIPCQLEVARGFGPDRTLVWGEEVDVRLDLRLDCGGRQVERLRVTELLPAGVSLVPGIGRAPEQDGLAPVWDFPTPGATIGLRYRLYASPDRLLEGDAEAIDLGWTSRIELRVEGQDLSWPPPELPALRIARRQVGVGCGLSRGREVDPEAVTAGDPFTVTLRVSPSLCGSRALRSRILLAFPPPADARARGEVLAAGAALVDRLQGDQAQLGLLVAGADGGQRAGPTTAYSALTDLAQALELGRPASDAAGMLESALQGLVDWPLHHEAIVLLLDASLPAADAARFAALEQEAADRGIELVTICVGGGCDQAVAIDHALASPGALRGWLRQDGLDAHRGPPARLDRLEVEEHLPRYLELEDGGSSPPAQAFGGDGLRWSVEDPQPGQVYALSYRARTRIWGRLPLGIGARARLWHADAGVQEFEIPSGHIEVAYRGGEEPGACQPQVGKTARPSRLPLGDEVELALDFGADCPDHLRPVDVVLALDVSGSMTGPKLEAARAAAEDFLDVMPPGQAQVGLLFFDQAAQERQVLTADFSPLRAALAGMQAGGGTDLALGIRESAAILEDRRDAVLPAILLMTDGFNNVGSAPVLEAADAAKAGGIQLVTICYGPVCDPSLVAAASSPAHAHHAEDGEALRRRFADLALAFRQGGLQSASIVDHLPPNLRYLPGSAEPPADWDPEARTLRWTLSEPASAGPRIRYRAEPLLLGRQTTSLGARFDFVDQLGRAGSADFPVPEVETYVPEPEGPCAPRIDKTADPLRLDLGQRAEVELTLDLDCPQRERPLDLVLLLDHSASMGSLERLPNVKRAAAAFLDRLDPAVVRVGLAAFADVVDVRLPLTEDHDAVLRAIEDLNPEGTTAISQALGTARELLADRRPEAGTLVLLLTDGQNTAGPEPMLAAAGRLRAEGAEILTICADPGRCDAALPLVASRPDYVFDVDQSAGLIDLLDRIALELIQVAVRELRIEDQLATAIEVEAGSIAPAPEAFDGRTITWTFDRLDAGGLTLRYQARPSLAGPVPVSRLARVDYRLGLGGRGRAWFPVPVLEVVDPDAPTPTPGGSATPSSTPTAGVTPTATPRRPTATGTAPVSPIFLPSLQR